MKKTKEMYFLEYKDYYSLLRSAGFKIGLEPLNMKRSDYEFIKDRDNPETIIIKFTAKIPELNKLETLREKFLGVFYFCFNFLRTIFFQL